MSFDEIIRNLKNKVYHPVYFLCGEEPYYIDFICDYIESHVLSDMEKEFNQTILYGRDCDLLNIISTAKRYPMMSNYQVVIIKEAQDIKSLIGKSDKEDDENNPFVNYLKSPQKSTVLVFCYKYKTIDKRTKIAKTIDKHSVLFESKKLYDSAIPEWVTSYLKNKGYAIEERASLLIGEYIGNDLSRIANEMDKLSLNVPKQTKIDASLIEQYIGISKDYNVFELQHALGIKNVLKANRIASYFAANEKNNPFVVTLGSLCGFFNKLMIYQLLNDKSEKNVAVALGVNPYFVKDYIKASANYKQNKLIEIFSLLHEYDLKSKGVNNESANAGELLKEMVFKILH
jgi:DNA polymerase-3 subunit delta